MTTPLVDRLQEVRCDREPFSPEHAKCICRLTGEAADEIERLQTVIGNTAGTLSDWMAGKIDANVACTALVAVVMKAAKLPQVG